MSEAQHTPGPWHWDSDVVKGDPLGRVRYRVTAKGKTITQLYYNSDDPHAEQDAMLIASAPTMRDENARLRANLINCAARLEAYYGEDYPAVRDAKAALDGGKGVQG